MTTRAPITQNFSRSRECTWSGPTWPCLRWVQSTKILVTGCFLGKIRGCFISGGIGMFFNRPPTRRLPDSSMVGFSEDSALVDGRVFPDWRRWSSSWNEHLWTSLMTNASAVSSSVSESGPKLRSAFGIWELFLKRWTQLTTHRRRSQLENFSRSIPSFSTSVAVTRIDFFLISGSSGVKLPYLPHSTLSCEFIQLGRHSFSCCGNVLYFYNDDISGD